MGGESRFDRVDEGGEEAEGMEGLASEDDSGILGGVGMRVVGFDWIARRLARLGSQQREGRGAYCRQDADDEERLAFLPSPSDTHSCGRTESAEACKEEQRSDPASRSLQRPTHLKSSRSSLDPLRACISE